MKFSEQFLIQVRCHYLKVFLQAVHYVISSSVISAWHVVSAAAVHAPRVYVLAHLLLIMFRRVDLENLVQCSITSPTYHTNPNRIEETYAIQVCILYSF